MQIKNLSVSYGQNVVYDGFDMQTDDKKVTCILGESGCGKTTLLNAVSSLVPYKGEITPVKLSCVFQTPRLVPNLTALGNLKLIGAEEEEAKRLLSRVGLEGKINSYPSQLSGGERQRVALCRAFIYPAEVILMDEPFSSLDLKTKLSVMDLFRELREESGRGALFVTHDIDEALYLSDRIVIISGGKIIADYNRVPVGQFGAGSALREELVAVMLDRK